MAKEILSLRNIYRFLMVSDYPIHSRGIITKKNHTGLTMVKFWQENLLIDFRSQKHGKHIWRTEGARNRYVSEVCNRSDRFTNYKKYAEEIESVVNKEVVFRQIKQFTKFLIERNFDYEAFSRKLPAYIERVSVEDDFFTADAAVFFEQSLKQKTAFDALKDMNHAFCCAWFITMLMIHGLAGNGEGEACLRQIRSKQELSLYEMGKELLKNSAGNNRNVRFLTSKNSELCCTPLEPQHFFGREKELFELREMLNAGGRYLISGMGGIGKTELMRQFLKNCETDALADYICVIQYEGDLKESMVKAFPNIRGADIEEKFRTILSQITEHAGKKIVLFIDNMNKTEDEDSSLEIFDRISATVFITSRHHNLKNFETYSILPLSKEAGELVLRDNYGSPLLEEDKTALREILGKDLCRHTLTLRLLGHTAKNGGFTLSEIHNFLENNEMYVTYGKSSYESLNRLFHHMYDVAGLSEYLQKILELFSLLPYQSYSLVFIESFFRGYESESDTLAECMELLWRKGWLEEHDAGYSIHPFVAECVRPARITESDISQYCENVYAGWNMSMDCVEKTQEDWFFLYANRNADELQKKATLALLTVSNHLSGPMSERFIRLLVLAGQLQRNLYGNTAEGKKLWFKIKKECEVVFPELIIFLCDYKYPDIAELEQEYRRLEQGGRISERILNVVAVELANAFLKSGEAEVAESLITEVWEKNPSVEVMVSACLLFAGVVIEKGDFEAYGRWLHKGVEIGRANGLEGMRDLQQIIYALCELHTALGQFEEAEKVLREAEEITLLCDSMFLKLCVPFYRGTLAMTRGDAGYGIEDLKTAERISATYYSQECDREHYAVALTELAMAYNKAGNRSVSLSYYRQALEIYEKLSGHEQEKHRLLNNMGVMFLDWNKPEDALAYLTRGYEIIREKGGLAMAETENNLSKVWSMLGDWEKELMYLKRAAPVLEEIYGSEHPKVTYAKQRLYYINCKGEEAK